MSTEPDAPLIVPVNPMVILDRLTAQNVDPDKLGRVIDLVRDWNKDQAIKAFNRALNLSQAEMADVVDDAKNLQTGSTYALLETVQRVAKPVYCKHGFSLSWSESDPKDNLREILMTVRHVEGHVEVHRGHYPIDGEGPKGGKTMNPLQGTVSAHTYACRDMMRQFFNITLAGHDADGNYSPGGLSAQQIEELNDLLEKCDMAGWTEASKQQFWDWIFTEADTKKRMPEMKASDFGRAREDRVKWIKKYGKEAKK